MWCLVGGHQCGVWLVVISVVITSLCLSCSRSQLDSEEVVAELVHRFLLPEVQKCFVRERGTVDLPSL